MSRAPGKYVAGAMVPAGAALDRPDVKQSQIALLMRSSLYNILFLPQFRSWYNTAHRLVRETNVKLIKQQSIQVPNNNRLNKVVTPRLTSQNILNFVFPT
jgi:hypothetical protein